MTGVNNGILIKPKERVDYLISEINKHNYNYYVLDAPNYLRL